MRDDLIKLDDLTLADFGLDQIDPGQTVEMPCLDGGIMFAAWDLLKADGGFTVEHRLQYHANGTGTPYPVLTITRMADAA